MDMIAVKLNNPEDLLPNPSCPSGVMDNQKTIYTHAYESSKYPVIVLPEKIYDNTGDFLSDGYYSIALSDDKKFLLLIQSNILKAKIPAFDVVIAQKTQQELEEEQEYLNKIESENQKKRYRKYRQAKQEYENYKLKQQAKMRAEILDSGQGFFIVKYNNVDVSAKGYIYK